MKLLFRINLLLLMITSNSLLFGQEKCRVLKLSISDSYTGKCRNGLANGKGTAIGTDKYEGNFSKGLPEGKGTYTWANGATYEGQWSGGMRDGAGVYKIRIDNRDSLLLGLWKKDEYIGPVPPAPNVTYSSGVDRYNFKKRSSGLNRVLVDIYQNSSRNKSISGFSMFSSSGNDVIISQSVGFENVVFPVTIKIFYKTKNKLQQMEYTAKFEFIIYEPADWIVELHN